MAKLVTKNGLSNISFPIVAKLGTKNGLSNISFDLQYPQATLGLAVKLKRKPWAWLCWNVQVKLRTVFKITKIFFPNIHPRILEHTQPLVIPVHVQRK